VPVMSNVNQHLTQAHVNEHLTQANVNKHLTQAWGGSQARVAGGALGWGAARVTPNPYLTLNTKNSTLNTKH